MGAIMLAASKNSTKRAMTVMVAKPCNIPALFMVAKPLMISQIAYPIARVCVCVVCEQPERIYFINSLPIKPLINQFKLCTHLV